MHESQIEQLKSLPRRANETWQGGLVRMPAWIDNKIDEPYRPLLPLWVAVNDDKLHVGELLKPGEENLAAAVEALLEFACQDNFGGYWPGKIEVTDSALAEHLRDLLADAEIEVCLVERLKAVERVVDAMPFAKTAGQAKVSSLLDGEGVTLENLRSFAAAAAAFYQAEPWRYLTDTDIIRIEEPRSPRGMEYAVVLGAGRSVFGLGFYRSMAGYMEFRNGASETGVPRFGREGLWQLSFDPITEIPPKDADLWMDHQLPVAGRSAYPLVMNFQSGGRITRPSVVELSYLHALLLALSQTTEAEIDSGRWQKKVTTPDGSTVVALAIPDLLKPPTPQEWMKRGFAPDRRAHERLSADMDRYFRQHPPESIDEMNEATSRLFSGRTIDDMVTQPETPLEQAQDLCFQAFDAHGRRRVQLARQAIQTCPDCADAYVILAEQAGTLEAEYDFYRQGVAAGERALGKDIFKEEAGYFWGITPTRPYMRARFGLAKTLEQLGKIEESLTHYQDLLWLNPNDNQGVRYLLMPQLLKLGRDAEAARLLQEFKEEDSANWAYARALLAYRLSGKTPAAKRELRQAFRTNRYVPEVLIAKKPLPLPDRYSHGSPEEAFAYAEELQTAFSGTEGALDWLAAEYKIWQKESTARLKEQRRKKRDQEKKKKQKRKR